MSDRIIIGNNCFNTLVAITSDEVKNGLMYKPWPPPIMAFPFKSADIRKFWMKNTMSPLDIIFCRSGKVIAIYKGKPFSPDLIGPDEAVDLVVEFPEGTVESNNIIVGDNIKLSYSTKTLAKKFRNCLSSY